MIKGAILKKDTETFGKMDPYVKFSCEGKDYETTVMEGAGKTPVWNQVSF